jgi:hypothetical protein
MAAPLSVTTQGTIVLDIHLKPSNAKYIKYVTDGGISAAKAEYNGFRGSHPLHGFVLAAHEAFARHYTLELSPDDIFSVIAQGIGQHVARKPEALRHKLVKHAHGKVEIEVIRNEFVRGKTTRDDWMGVIAEWKEKAMDHVKQDDVVVRNLVGAHFSTTNEMHQLLYRAAALSVLQHYMNYSVMTFCGIPRIILHGTLEDWKQLEQKIKDLRLTEFDPELAEWDKVLQRIAAKLCGARERSDRPETITAEDVDFFRSFYKWNSGSGGDSVTGWINGLFPYLGARNHQTMNHLPRVYTKLTGDPSTMDKREWGSLGSVSADAFPTGLTDVPFTWKYMGTSIPMVVYVGFDEPERIEQPEPLIRTAMAFAVSY